MEQQAQQQQQAHQQQQQAQQGAMGTPSIPNGNGESALDRQMLRHLMARYSEQELARLILEERASPLARMSLTSTSSTIKIFHTNHTSL